MLTKELIVGIVKDADLTIRELKLYPFGRDWQAIVFFNDVYGISLLYKMPIHYEVPKGDDFGMAIVEHFDDNSGFFLSYDHEDHTVYDISRDNLVDFLKLFFREETND